MNTGTFHEKAEATHEVLSNRQNIRRYLKTNEIHLDQFTRLIDRMNAVRDDMLHELEIVEAAHNDKMLRVEEAKKLLKENGLSIEDIVSTERGNGLPRKAKGLRSDAGKPKSNPLAIYEFEDRSGNTKQIELGRIGRPPEEFSEYLQKTGKKRKDCLIRELETEGVSVNGEIAKEASKKNPKKSKQPEASETA